MMIGCVAVFGHSVRFRILTVHWFVFLSYWVLFIVSMTELFNHWRETQSSIHIPSVEVSNSGRISRSFGCMLEMLTARNAYNPGSLQHRPTSHHLFCNRWIFLLLLRIHANIVVHTSHHIDSLLRFMDGYARILYVLNHWSAFPVHAW